MGNQTKEPEQKAAELATDTATAEKEAEQIEAEKAEQVEQERLEAEKAEQSRIETERIELEKQHEAEQAEHARLEAEKLEAEKEANRIKLAQAIGKELTKEKTKPTKLTKEHKTLLAQYIERYPGNKTFHITSDNQVFLAPSKNFAQAHQKNLKTGELQTININ